MDNTIKRVVNEVAGEIGLDPGLLMDIIELEEEKSHFSRRHKIFDELKELTRKAALRDLSARGTDK